MDILGSGISKGSPDMLIVCITPSTAVLQETQYIFIYYSKNIIQTKEGQANVSPFIRVPGSLLQLNCMCIKKNWRLTATYGAFSFL
jgi:hypothetical protein